MSGCGGSVSDSTDFRSEGVSAAPGWSLEKESPVALDWRPEMEKLWRRKAARDGACRALRPRVMSRIGRAEGVAEWAAPVRAMVSAEVSRPEWRMTLRDRMRQEWGERSIWLPIRRQDAGRRESMWLMSMNVRRRDCMRELSEAANFGFPSEVNL